MEATWQDLCQLCYNHLPNKISQSNLVWSSRKWFWFSVRSSQHGTASWSHYRADQHLDGTHLSLWRLELGEEGAWLLKLLRHLCRKESISSAPWIVPSSGWLIYHELKSSWCQNWGSYQGPLELMLSMSQMGEHIISELSSICRNPLKPESLPTPGDITLCKC